MVIDNVAYMAKMPELLEKLKERADDNARNLIDNFNRISHMMATYAQIRDFWTVRSPNEPVLLDFGVDKDDSNIILGILVSQSETGEVESMEIAENIAVDSDISIGEIPLFYGLDHIYVMYNYELARDELQHFMDDNNSSDEDEETDEE